MKKQYYQLDNYLITFRDFLKMLMIKESLVTYDMSLETFLSIYIKLKLLVE